MEKEFLGREAKDRITGFKGIIVGYCQYLFGCNQYGITPRTLKDGKRGETEWFDEGRVIITGKGVSAKEVQVERPGSDNQDHP